LLWRSKLCKNARPQPSCWAKLACFDFSLPNYVFGSTTADPTWQAVATPKVKPYGQRASRSFICTQLGLNPGTSCGPPGPRMGHTSEQLPSPLGFSLPNFNLDLTYSTLLALL
jgi:hypothetical protein